MAPAILAQWNWHRSERRADCPWLQANLVHGHRRRARCGCGQAGLDEATRRSTKWGTLLVLRHRPRPHLAKAVHRTAAGSLFPDNGLLAGRALGARLTASPCTARSFCKRRSTSRSSSTHGNGGSSMLASVHRKTAQDPHLQAAPVREGSLSNSDHSQTEALPVFDDEALWVLVHESKPAEAARRWHVATIGQRGAVGGG
jgi:hypothetical protein